jgi:hypothetical protein
MDHLDTETADRIEGIVTLAITAKGAATRAEVVAVLETLINNPFFADPAGGYLRGLRVAVSAVRRMGDS